MLVFLCSYSANHYGPQSRAADLQFNPPMMLIYGPHVQGSEWKPNQNPFDKWLWCSSTEWNPVWHLERMPRSGASLCGRRLLTRPRTPCRDYSKCLRGTLFELLWKRTSRLLFPPWHRYVAPVWRGYIIIIFQMQTDNLLLLLLLEPLLQISWITFSFP